MEPSLKTHFLNLYSMALADMEFAENEIATFYSIVEKRGMSKDEVDYIILNPATAKFTIPESLSDKVEYLYDYAKMVLADGKIEESEISTLEKFCLKFEFEPQNISSIRELLLEAAKNNVSTAELLNFINQTT